MITFVVLLSDRLVTGASEALKPDFLPRFVDPGSDPRQVYPFSGRGTLPMHRYAKLLLYGMLAFIVFAGISFTIGGRVNWVLAAATAIGVMIAYFFAALRGEK
jgi:hypothetical protein